MLKGGANIADFTPELHGARAPGAGHLVPASLDRRAERRHAPPPPDRARRAAATALRGTFAMFSPRPHAAGVQARRDPDAVCRACASARCITAHPTESKRVTVLEKYRRIYLLLRELEMPRWTERERTALIDDLRDQIELVWMTGELHLEKPTVEQEVSRGLHFFDETLFEMAPEMLCCARGALAAILSGRRISSVPPFFQFGSWIGGDRDGNPSVTTRVTAQRRCKQNALASLAPLPRRASPSLAAVAVDHRARLAGARGFRAELARELAASGRSGGHPARNPGEPYRQYLTFVLRKLDATLARTEGMDIAGPGGRITPAPTS